jgi:manganese efflux pump family protein
MDAITILLIAIGLSMDALAVSITSGAAIKKPKPEHALKIALFFGVFQAGMPVLGWLGGTGLKNFISGIDHWVAFIILSAVGIKMIYESAKGGEKEIKDPLDTKVLFMLAIATSLDALAVGVSMSFMDILILVPAIAIGVVTYLISFMGVFIGGMAGKFAGRKTEIAGGIILIMIGVKILAEHL